MAQHAVWEVCAQIGKSCPGGLLRSTWRVSTVASRRQEQCWNGTAVRTRKLEWGNQSGQVERLPYPAFKETRKHQTVSKGYCWPESLPINGSTRSHVKSRILGPQSPARELRTPPGSGRAKTRVTRTAHVYQAFRHTPVAGHGSAHVPSSQRFVAITSNPILESKII